MLLDAANTAAPAIVATAPSEMRTMPPAIAPGLRRTISTCGPIGGCWPYGAYGGAPTTYGCPYPGGGGAYPGGGAL